MRPVSLIFGTMLILAGCSASPPMRPDDNVTMLCHDKAFALKINDLWPSHGPTLWFEVTPNGPRRGQCAGNNPRCVRVFMQDGTGVSGLSMYEASPPRDAMPFRHGLRLEQPPANPLTGGFNRSYIPVARYRESMFSCTVNKFGENNCSGEAFHGGLRYSFHFDRALLPQWRMIVDQSADLLARQRLTAVPADLPSFPAGYRPFSGSMCELFHERLGHIHDRPR